MKTTGKERHASCVEGNPSRLEEPTPKLTLLSVVLSLPRGLEWAIFWGYTEISQKFCFCKMKAGQREVGIRKYIPAYHKTIFLLNNQYLAQQNPTDSPLWWAWHLLRLIHDLPTYLPHREYLYILRETEARPWAGNSIQRFFFWKPPSTHVSITISFTARFVLTTLLILSPFTFFLYGNSHG